MAANSKIEWTDHTFNPWRGCTKVSAGCANCYAESMSKRNPKVLGVWGDNGTRVVASESMWREPLKWERAGDYEPEKPSVFCASLADVCEDRPDLLAPRARLKKLIENTQGLNWLLLTKRPEDYPRLFWGDNWPPNVWAGTSVENRNAADERIDELRKVPAAIRFLSIEPLLEDLGTIDLTGIHWVIVGGESGPGARDYVIEYDMDIAAQCKGAGVPLFRKQLGSRPVMQNVNLLDWPDDMDFERYGEFAAGGRIPLKDRKGGDWSEWPEDLRVREFPKR